MRVLWNFLLSFFFLTTPGLICSALHVTDLFVHASVCRAGSSGSILQQQQHHHQQQHPRRVEAV